MTGRGRRCEAESPDKTRQDDMKPPGQEKDLSEDKQNSTQKIQKSTEEEKIIRCIFYFFYVFYFFVSILKMMNKCGENPRQQNETTKLQKATGNKKALVPDARPKTQIGKVKKVQFADGIKETQQETPKDTPVDLKIQPEAPEDTETDLMKTCAPQKKCADKNKEDSILSTTLDKLKIRAQERCDTSEVINNLVLHIRKHMKENTQCFKDMEEPLRTGSYYEKLKISNPDEFDVMLPIPVDRINIKPFGEDGAFYSVELKRSKSHLKKFQQGDTLSASQMLHEFREEVKKCAKKFPEWEMTKKKKGCPAVTLTTTVKSVTISLDLVLSIVVKSSWPAFTNDGLKIKGWLGGKVRQQFKSEPYYLVPKYEGNGMVEKDGVLTKDVWRVSFSHIEKKIFMNHGSEKTCCEKDGARCCRKDCLKLLKHLLSLLKEKDSSFKKFCSYHAKTTLLHACCSRMKDSNWRASDLPSCFQLLLNDFVEHLENGVLPNFFIPSQNLLSGPGKNRCRNLARCIREECDLGFPIFK